MKTILYATALLMSSYSFAEFKLTFNHKAPEQVTDENGIYTEHVRLNLQLKAQLANEEDYPRISSQINYSYNCQGDEPMWLNKKANTISGPYSLLDLSFKQDKPMKWNAWSAGTKECTLTWNGLSLGSSDLEHKTLALSATDLETGVVYDRSSASLSLEQRNLSKAQQHTFTMTKLKHHYVYDPNACKNETLQIK